MMSFKKIEAELNLSAPKSSILKCLNSVPLISNQKMKKKSMLIRKNADRRFNWTTEKVGLGIEWEKIIYNDKKVHN